MITIIHGENVFQSRKKLLELISQAKKEKTEVIKFEGKQLDEATLEEALGKSSLFGNKKLIVIEQLHSTPRSKKKNQLIALIASADNQDIILWEKRKLTPTMIKKFSGATVFAFKPTETLFSWLDSLDPNKKKKQLQMFQKAVEKNDVHMCFVMLIRQVRLLISVKSGGKIKGPPFMIQKLRSQASRFSLPQLIKLHSSFFTIDQEIKTSAGNLTLKQSLDLQLISM